MVLPWWVDHIELIESIGFVPRKHTPSIVETKRARGLVAYLDLHDSMGTQFNSFHVLSWLNSSLNLENKVA